MIKKIVTYPRGFQGFDIGIPIETKGDTIMQALKNISYNRSGEDLSFVISNKNVENLWKQMVNGSGFTSNMEFREKILTNALSAFGTESFLEWVELQEVNNAMTDMHRRFINDTFTFIDTGRRAMSIHSWAELVYIREVTAKDAVPEIRKVDFFKLSGALQYRRVPSLGDIITRWVCQPNGFDDLAGTLHILFGNTEN